MSNNYRRVSFFRLLIGSFYLYVCVSVSKRATGRNHLNDFKEITHVYDYSLFSYVLKTINKLLLFFGLRSRLTRQKATEKRHNTQERISHLRYILSRLLFSPHQIRFVIKLMNKFVLTCSISLQCGHVSRKMITLRELRWARLSVVVAVSTKRHMKKKWQTISCTLKMTAAMAMATATLLSNVCMRVEKCTSNRKIIIETINSSKLEY